jgi:hypothetical protein
LILVSRAVFFCSQELAALEEAEVEGHEPLDISWPKNDRKKQVSYLLLFPIMIALYMTLPDTRTPRGKRFFVWGFVGSILWIAIFSYFMVWWADRTGETFSIPPEVRQPLSILSFRTHGSAAYRRHNTLHKGGAELCDLFSCL